MEPTPSSTISSICKSPAHRSSATKRFWTSIAAPATATTSASSPTRACRTRMPRATCGCSPRTSCRSSRSWRSRRPPRPKRPWPPAARTSGPSGLIPFETLLYDDADGIATLTLNRPDRLNAVNATVIRELVAAFDRADGDDGVRAVIVTGAGRAFCAGADLGGGGTTFDGRGERPEDPRDGGGLVTLRIFEMTKPVIAAINGPAVGFGITLTLAMDVRLASSAAKIGFVFARRGVVPEAASTWFLPRLVGVAQAAAWTYTGRVSRP